MTSAQERTRALKDELRIHHGGGKIVITAGVKAFGPLLVRRLDDALSGFNEFDEDSDLMASMPLLSSRSPATRSCSKSTCTMTL